MNVSLTPELEKLVNRKVKSGRYQTASEVVREALRALEERDQFTAHRLAELRKEIAKGLKSGASEPLDVDDLKREVRRRMTRAPRSPK
jgi:antitoxin ParD1/3/4